MSNQRGQWISRRGQADASAAIDQVIDHRPQPGERIQQLADDLIDDNPYQARRSFSAASVEDLAQGMRETGFQGVLIVRPHGDVTQRGRYQLVYGHRRRVAWRQVCADRHQACVLPVVVRDVSDAEMLTIGAQENLQRQDLDPIEEGQIVARLERMFFDKNQTELGTMLGKSSDWISIRSRVHRLPEALKERLRQRPRAISQILELSGLYAAQPDRALTLADQVVAEQLTLDAVRALVRDYARPDTRPTNIREIEHKHRGAATDDSERTRPEAGHPKHGDHGPQTEPQAFASRSNESATQANQATPETGARRSAEMSDDAQASDQVLDAHAQLQEAMTRLSNIAARAGSLTHDPSTILLLDSTASAIDRLREELVRRALAGYLPNRPPIYRISGMTIDEALIRLCSHRPIEITLQSAGTEGISLRVVLCLLATDAISAPLSQRPLELFIAVAQAGNTTTPISGELSADWVRQRLKLRHRPAILVAALLNDLLRNVRYLQRG